jgi:hypothetical protein
MHHAEGLFLSRLQVPPPGGRSLASGQDLEMSDVRHSQDTDRGNNSGPACRCHVLISPGNCSETGRSGGSGHQTRGSAGRTQYRNQTPNTAGRSSRGQSGQTRGANQPGDGAPPVGSNGPGHNAQAAGRGPGSRGQTCRSLRTGPHSGPASPQGRKCSPRLPRSGSAESCPCSTSRRTRFLWAGPGTVGSSHPFSTPVSSTGTGRAGRSHRGFWTQAHVSFRSGHETRCHFSVRPGHETRCHFPFQPGDQAETDLAFQPGNQAEFT